MKRFLAEFGANESGATAIEYSLILAGIFILIVAATRVLGTSVAESLEAAAAGFA